MENLLSTFLHNVRLEQLVWSLDLLLASFLGFLIGLERKFRSKEAGIRTHTVVCFGSALMMLISKYAFGDEVDTSRVAAQIVTGIGFLGAGIIVYKKNIAHGLTTAAGVWATAGVGMACGGGLWLVAIISALILVAIQWILHRKIFRNKRLYSIKIVFTETDNEREQVKQLFNIERYNKLVVERSDDKLVYRAYLNTEIEYRSYELNDIMKKYDFISYIERVDEN